MQRLVYSLCIPAVYQVDKHEFRTGPNGGYSYIRVGKGKEKNMADTASAPEYTRAERWSVLFSTVLGFLLDFYNILIVSFLLSAIQQSLDISLAQAGVITSVTLFASLFGGIFFGWFGDKIGRRTSLLVTLGLFSIGAILSAFAWNYASLLVFRAIAGIGLGGEWGAGMVLFNEVWNRNRRGTGSSVIQSASLGGLILAAIVSIWAVNTFSPEWGWRIALLTGGSPILLMAFVRFFMPESRLWSEYNTLRRAGQLPEEKARETISLLEIFRGAALRYTLLALLVTIGYMFAFYAMTTFMPALMGQLGVPSGGIRSINILVAAVSIPFFILVGYYSDLRGRKWATIVPALIGVVGYIAIYFTGSVEYPGTFWTWALFWWYMFWWVGQASACMFGPWFSELYPVELRASAVSTIYMIGRGIGTFAPPVVSAVAAGFGGNLFLGIMVGLAGSLLVLVASLVLPETAGRRFAVIESKKREAEGETAQA
jgi:MFS family permease